MRHITRDDFKKPIKERTKAKILSKTAILSKYIVATI